MMVPLLPTFSGRINNFECSIYRSNFENTRYLYYLTECATSGPFFDYGQIQTEQEEYKILKLM